MNPKLVAPSPSSLCGISTSLWFPSAAVFLPGIILVSRWCLLLERELLQDFMYTHGACVKFGLNSDPVWSTFLTETGWDKKWLLGAPIYQSLQRFPYVWDDGSRELDGCSSTDDGSTVMHLRVNKPGSHIGGKKRNMGCFFSWIYFHFCGLFSADCFYFLNVFNRRKRKPIESAHKEKHN